MKSRQEFTVNVGKEDMRILALMMLMVVGCGKGGEITIGEPPKAKPTDQNTTKPLPEKNNTSTNSPPKPTDQNSTKTTPRKLTAEEEKVVGTYEFKEDGDTFKGVILENGTVEGYKNGKKQEEDYKWSLSKVNKDGVLTAIELHVEYKDGIVVFRINKDGSLTAIGHFTRGGEREDVPKDKQITAKKIK